MPIRSRKKTEKQRPSFADRLRDTAGLEQALQRGVAEALREHALMGRKVPIWQNGKVEWILPDIEQLNAELAKTSGTGIGSGVAETDDERTEG